MKRERERGEKEREVVNHFFIFRQDGVCVKTLNKRFGKWSRLWWVWWIRQLSSWKHEVERYDGAWQGREGRGLFWLQAWLVSATAGKTEIDPEVQRSLDTGKRMVCHLDTSTIFKKTKRKDEEEDGPRRWRQWMNFLIPCKNNKTFCLLLKGPLGRSHDNHKLSMNDRVQLLLWTYHLVSVSEWQSCPSWILVNKPTFTMSLAPLRLARWDCCQLSTTFFRVQNF